MYRSSRELSSRVNIDVHRLPNLQRRSAWWLAVSTGVGSLVWLIMQFVQGQNRLYESGEVSTTHRMFENECWRCHQENTWTPLKRLIRFDDELHSTDNKSCETCHHVAAHQPHQLPAHQDIPCAKCHQEHRGTESLARPRDQHCRDCHDNLKSHGGKGGFTNQIKGFDLPDGHPEFLVNRLITNDNKKDNDGDDQEDFLAATAKRAETPENLAVEKFQRSGEEHLPPRWQDRGRIRFNHATHLHARYDNQGALVEGLLDENRKPVDLSNKCETCHQPDPDHRFFRPIQFEAHCCRCHPLLFDREKYPHQSVPHELPEIVRGFLTETYTLRTLRGANSPIQAAPQQFCASFPQPRKTDPNEEVNDAADQPRRPLPGHRDQQSLTQELAAGVLIEVDRAEVVVLGPRDYRSADKSTGGCRYCHDVEQDLKAVSGDWRIVPPKIPSRWLPHGEFHHEPHRLMSCGVCHVGVAVSDNTGDVLIPSRAVCLACHATNPKDWASTWTAWFEDKEEEIKRRENLLAEKRKKWDANATETRDGTAITKLASSERPEQSFQELLKNAVRGTRTDCIECHSYHNPNLDKWNGPFVDQITKRPKPKSRDAAK
ncbi:MAG: hypothetical protein ACKV2Q_32595 [Planctomycetaceae bacterium]